MDVCVPSVSTSDQGADFISSLTKEFLKVFGIAPRFNTPGHLEAAEIVERRTQTFEMIHQIIINIPREWKYLPRIEESTEKPWILIRE